MRTAEEASSQGGRGASGQPDFLTGVRDVQSTDVRYIKQVKHHSSIKFPKNDSQIEPFMTREPVVTHQ